MIQRPRTTPPTSRPATGRAVAALALAALVTVSCGGDDDTAGADDTVAVDAPAAVPSSTATGQGDAIAGPVSTISPEVPEEFLPAIGPVDVGGSPLPPLDTSDIDDDPALGQPAPTLVGLDYAGRPVRVDAAQDGPTMVVFLAHWCPHCNDEIPVINELRDDGRFPEGLNIVAISTAANAGRPNFPPGDWLADKDWTYPAMADGVDVEAQSFVAADAFGVTAFPFVTLIDGDGNVAARWAGGRSGDEFVELTSSRLEL